MSWGGAVVWRNFIGFPTASQGWLGVIVPATSEGRYILCPWETWPWWITCWAIKVKPPPSFNVFIWHNSYSYTEAGSDLPFLRWLHLQVPDGFFAHFYAICEHISPVLAWGFLGPRNSLYELCNFFKVCCFITPGELVATNLILIPI